MSRFTGPKGKVCRRFGTNIYGNPKFDRLLAKRETPPGEHGPRQRRRKTSEYGQQLMEKQKLKFTYGLREREFRNIFQRALKAKGITGDLLLVLLESRLDNVVYRAGWAGSRDQARQLVLHGHIKVNNRRVNISSFHVSENDLLSVKSSSRSEALVRRYIEENGSRPGVDWISNDNDSLKADIVRSPLREEIESIANEQLVVELYSK